MSRRVVITSDHPMRRSVLRDVHNGRETGTVFYSECRLCGYVEWTTTKGSEPADFLVAEFQDASPNECRRCGDAFRRSPEIADWVQGIANKLHTEVTKEIDDLKAEPTA